MKSMEQIKRQQRNCLDRLITFAGSQTRLARELGISAQVVHNWVARGRISATYAIDVEKITEGKFTKEDLRPDVITWNE